MEDGLDTLAQSIKHQGLKLMLMTHWRRAYNRLEVGDDDDDDDVVEDPKGNSSLAILGASHNGHHISKGMAELEEDALTYPIICPGVDIRRKAATAPVQDVHRWWPHEGTSTHGLSGDGRVGGGTMGI
ncbi:hypothetical protein Pelo_1204 [Pelomyxa schiedti]|nr:hypothetical protein Pelo_1204 [Pelomyxa schiedti]